MSAEIEGGCLCGGVRYRLYTAPARLSDCHCIDCRRASAAPFVTWGEVPRDDIELLSGELRKVGHATDCALLPVVAGRRCSFKTMKTRSPSTLQLHRWIIPSLIRPLSLFGLRIGSLG